VIFTISENVVTMRVTHVTDSLCYYHFLAFQAGSVGSIPITRLTTQSLDT